LGVREPELVSKTGDLASSAVAEVAVGSGVDVDAAADAEASGAGVDEEAGGVFTPPFLLSFLSLRCWGCWPCCFGGVAFSLSLSPPLTLGGGVALPDSAGIGVEPFVGGCVFETATAGGRAAALVLGVCATVAVRRYAKLNPRRDLLVRYIMICEKTYLGF